MEKTKILLIDDEARIRQTFARTLKLAGYIVITAENGEAGLALFDAEQPDIVLLDLRMPGIDGLAVLQEMRKRDPEANVILCTEHSDKNAVLAALRAGASDFLSKSIDHVALERALRRAEERIDLKRKLRASEETLRQQNAHLEDLVQARTVALEREVVGRKQAEQQVRSQNAFLENILESLTHPLYVIDAEDYTVQLANIAARRGNVIEGATCHALTHQSGHPCEGEKHLCPLAEVKATRQPVVCQHIHTDPQGNQRYVEIHGFPIFNDAGEVVQMIEYCLDVTERELATGALRENEAFLNTLLEAIPIPVFYKDREGRYLGFNSAFESFFGQTREQLIGKSVFDISPPELADIYYAQDNALLEEGGTQRYESQVKDAQGVLHDVMFNKAVFTDSQGTVRGLVGGILDITDRKRAEEALRQSLIDLRLAQKIAAIGNWEFDPAVGVPVWSEEVYRIYNRDPQLGPPHIDEYKKMYEPDQFTIFNTAIQRAIKEGQPYDITLKLKLPEGVVKWIHAICQPDAPKGPAGYFLRGTIQDVTARKRTEDALRQSEARYRRAQQIGHVGNWEYNLQTTAFWGSEEAKRIYGFDPATDWFTTEEVEGCIPDRENVHQALVDLIERDKEYRLEFDIITKNTGERRTISSIAELERDADGTPLKVTGVIQDITARQQAEEALRRIEWLLTKSVAPANASGSSYQPPYGDVTELNTCRVILDAVGRDALQQIAENTIDLLDTSVAVYEQNGDYAFGMFSSGWCQVMDVASRRLCGDVDNREALTCGKWLCHENCWHDSAQAAIETGQATDIACVGGIHLYAVPIFAGDEVVGVINIGYGDPPRDAPTLEKLAADFDINLEALQTHARAYQTRPTYIVDLAKKRLHTTAMLIGEMVERKQAEEALRVYTERLRIQHEIDVAILRAQSAEAIAVTTLERLQHLIPCRRLSVAEVDLEQQWGHDIVVLADGESVPTPMADWHPLADIGTPLLRALEREQTFSVDDIAALTTPSSLEQTLLTHAGVRSYISVPLVVQDTLFGALNLASEIPNFFQPAHHEILEEVAASLAVALQQARLLEQAQQDAETKALLLREVNHRVKNNLDAILGLFYLERRHASAEALAAYQPIMDALTQRITSLAEVHRMLSAVEWQPLLLHELAEQIIYTMLDAALQAVPVSVVVAPASVRVTPDQAHHLALVISELITNTLKYAAGARDTLHVTVDIAQQDGEIIFIYRDDGPGYPEEALTLQWHSVGLEIIQKVVQRNLRGSLVLRNEGGAVTEIRFCEA